MPNFLRLDDRNRCFKAIRRNTWFGYSLSQRKNPDVLDTHIASAGSATFTCQYTSDGHEKKAA
jgi:hypothetical protein